MAGSDAITFLTTLMISFSYYFAVGRKVRSSGQEQYRHHPAAVSTIPFSGIDNVASTHKTPTFLRKGHRLRAKCEALQRSQRNFLGEDLQPLAFKELEKIEKQLDKTLSQARQRKEQELEEENRQLKTKLEEVLRLPVLQGVGDPSKADGNKHSQSQPTLQMGYHQYVYQEQAFDARTIFPGKSNPIPRWFS
uniref:K-box domain-containing protein n=1 Tax=Salix viminalis TaxID=40686 RepID=A0A6N2KBF1_SALVM